jgi:hypothetical protein
VYVAYVGEKREAFRVLVGKPKEKGPQEGLKRRLLEKY